MEISTKYDIGQTVYTLVPSIEERIWKTCPLCKGTGDVRIAVEEVRWIKCVDCFGQGTVPEKAIVPPLARPLTIGQADIRVRVGSKAVSYMCQETGIGSGTIHPEDTLFRTAEDAYDSEDRDVE